MNLTRFLATFLLAISVAVSSRGQQGTGREEQDYHFAVGLFKDGHYRFAYEQFTSFAERYDGSSLRVDAEYYRGECLFQEGKLTDAAIRFGDFARRFPESKLADDAGFREGEVYFRQGFFDKAMVQFVRVLEHYQEGNLAHESAYWAGESAFKMDDFRNARKYYAIARDHYPDGRIRDYASYSLAFVDEETGNFTKAREQYHQFAEDFPQSALLPAAMTRISACLYGDKEYAKAISHLDSLSDSPDPENAAERLFLKADSYYLMSRYAEAAQFYRDFLSAYPHHGRSRQVQYGLGWANLKMGKYPEALSAFERLDQGDDHLAQAAHFRKGVVYRLNGQAAEAKAIFREIVETRPNGAYTDNALFELGMLAHAAGDHEPALQLFTKASALPASDIEADIFSMIGECSLALRRYRDAAIGFSRAAIAKNGDSTVKSASLFRLGYSQHLAGNEDSAIAAFERYLREQPSGAFKQQALIWLGEANFAAGKYADAVIYYNQALTTEPDPAAKPAALYGLGWSHYKLREYFEAERVFRRLVTEFKGSKFDMDALVRLGDAQFASKKFGEAAKSYRQAAQTYPDHGLASYALLQLGNAEARSGDIPAGLSTLKSSLARFPDSEASDDMQYSIGWLYFQNKDYDVAIGEFRKMIERHPTSPLVANAKYSIGDSYYNQGRYADAERAYRNLVDEHADSPLVPDALEGIGQALRMQGKDTEASAVKDAWLRSHPASAAADGIAFTTAKNHYQEKDPQAASVALQSFLRTYPSSAHYQEALVLLGECYRETGRIDDAHKTFQQAVDADPKSSAAVDARLNIAALHLVYQERREAIAIYDELLGGTSVQQRGAELHYLKGVALMTDRQDSAATSEFREAIASDHLGQYTDLARIRLARLDAHDSTGMAITQLEEIATRRTDDIGAEAQYTLGDVLLGTGDTTAAEKALLRVGYVHTASSAWIAKSWLLLGRLYESRDEKEQAAKQYRKLIAQFGGTPEATDAQQRLERLK